MGCEQVGDALVLLVVEAAGFFHGFGGCEREGAGFFVAGGEEVIRSSKALG